MKLIFGIMLLASNAFAHNDGDASHHLIEGHHGSPLIWILGGAAALLVVYKVYKERS